VSTGERDLARAAIEPQQPELEKPWRSLTTTEWKVARRVALPYKQMAAALGMQPETARSHVNRIAGLLRRIPGMPAMPTLGIGA
jgi:DNA-binding CsgD family transcriptional regulator